MNYESSILKRLIGVYGVVGNPRYISEIIKQFIVQGKECYPNLFTYQSDWLAHIDEFGLSSDYVVSYTGQSIYAPNTLEKPVKHAILKGNTKLVDKFGYELDTIDNVSIITTKGYMLNISTGEQTEIDSHKVTDFIYLKDSITKITFDGGVTQRICFYNYDKTFIRGDSTEGTETKTFNVPEGAKYFRISYNFSTELTTINDQNGTKVYDYNNDLQLVSVKMPVLTTTGEQLLNVNDLDSIVSTDGTIPTKPTIIDFENGIVQIEETAREVNKGYKIKVERNKDYIGNCKSINSEYIRCRILDLNGNRLDTGQEYIANKTFKFNSGENDYIVVAFTCHVTPKQQVQLALYEGTVLPTTYKPFKSNILTVNEDVTLRSNGNVYDELDLLTGKLIQRIDEDGSVLTQEVVKTVDLTIHDKDHQKVERLTSFEGGTHFTTTSQDGSLLPTLTVDVVTDLEETLMVCSLEGNTI